MDANTPEFIFTRWDEQIAKIEAAKAKFGNEIKPGDYKI